MRITRAAAAHSKLRRSLIGVALVAAVAGGLAGGAAGAGAGGGAGGGGGGGGGAGAGAGQPPRQPARARSAAVRKPAPRGPRCVPARMNASAALSGSGLVVSPLPGSYDASPGTQISLLGAPAQAIAGVRVSGSRSGAHRGALRAYSQGDGASFVPAKSFVAGEYVSVRGDVRTGSSSRRFVFGFTVAHPLHVPYYIPVHRHGPDPNEKMHFASEPQLAPPSLAVTARSVQSAPGLVFAAPYAGPGASGPMIFDESGSLVWFHPLPHGTEATNLQVQQLEGAPVLTWWQGYIPPQGFGEGEEVIVSSAYQQLLRVRAGNGLSADLHDFHITPQGTALLTAYDPIACDLSASRGPRAGYVTDGLFQELDLRSGLVRREWHSLDHVPLGDSYSSPASASSTWPFDYFHINSLDVPTGGRMLVTARNTWAIYDVRLSDGRVLTRIGGKHSDVKLVRGSATAYQHDGSRLPDGTIGIFDNGALPKIHSQSRGVVVAIDEHSRTDRFLSQYLHPTPLTSGSQGNLQLLGNGDVFIGWGSAPFFSEFSSSGQLLFDAHMHGSYQSYRAYRFTWTGAPAGAPAIAASGPASGPLTVYASWNGDTRTASWRVLSGPSAAQLSPVATAAKSGFETAIPTPGPAAYVAVQALDAAGAVLGTSRAVPG